jgi:peptidoglycan/LPS O-acetylase OafA/YrhL
MASLGAPDGAIVAALGAVIFFLARLADSGSELLSAAPLVYLGEISYSVYMVCIPWKIVFVNGVNRAMQLNDPHLPLPLWLGLVFGVIPLAALSYHLIEKPARTALKLMADSGATRRPSAASA